MVRCTRSGLREAKRDVLHAPYAMRVVLIAQRAGWAADCRLRGLRCPMHAARDASGAQFNGRCTMCVPAGGGYRTNPKKIHKTYKTIWFRIMAVLGRIQPAR